MQLAKRACDTQRPFRSHHNAPCAPISQRRRGRHPPRPRFGASCDFDDGSPLSRALSGGGLRGSSQLGSPHAMLTRCTFSECRDGCAARLQWWRQPAERRTQWRRRKQQHQADRQRACRAPPPHVRGSSLSFQASRLPVDVHLADGGSPLKSALSGGGGGDSGSGSK